MNHSHSAFKTILVTGNMGYVGPHVVRRLVRSYPKAKLIGLDVGYFAHCLTSSALLPETRVNVQHFLDIRDLKPELLKGVDAVVHLAALSNDALGMMSDKVTLDVNFRASIRLARWCRAAGVRSFVFASSCSVYGFSENGICSESSPVHPLTAYAKSKVMVEEGLKPLAGKDFKITCLRFATACGMSERLRLDLVLNQLVHSAMRQKQIKVLSDGTPWRPLIHVRDMAAAMDWALGRPVQAGGPYLIVNAGANQANYQVRDLAYAVQKCFPGIEVSINDHALPDKRSYRVAFDLFKKLAPRYQPQIKLEEAIVDIKNGLASLEPRDVEIRDASLIRMNVLQELNHLNYCGRGVRLRKCYA